MDQRVHELTARRPVVAPPEFSHQDQPPPFDAVDPHVPAALERAGRGEQAGGRVEAHAGRPLAPLDGGDDHPGGPVDQGAFLTALGIELRAAQLARSAPAAAAAITAARKRLTDPEQMGSLFKALALTPRDLPPPAGFA